MTNRLTLFLLAGVSSATPASSLWAQERPTDQWLTQPVDDRTFRTYLDFFAYSRDLPFESQVLGTEEAEGIRQEHLSFQSTPGERVFARLYQSSSGGVGGGAVILVHGGSPRGKNSGYLRVNATLLARAGWTVLAIDMQYFGERSTELLQTFTEPEKHERLYNQPSTYLAWMAQNVKDVGRSIDFLVRERGVDSLRIAFVGISRGAQVGAIVGAAEPRIAAVALLHGGHLDALETGHLPAACPANYIGRISPRPLFMLNGEHDADYLKETSVLPLQRLARDPKQFRWNDSGHGVITEDDQTALLEWLRANVM